MSTKYTAEFDEAWTHAKVELGRALLDEHCLSHEEALARINLALQMIWQVGSFDEAHHKQWLLDQLVRAYWRGRPQTTGRSV